MNKNKFITKKILNVLKKTLSYSNLQNEVSSYLKFSPKIMTINFQDSLFSKKGRFHFPYTLESAKLILLNSTIYSSSKELIEAHYFKDALNLHPSSYSLINTNIDYELLEFNEFDEENFTNSQFVRSGLSQDEYFSSLKISSWSYDTLVVSAAFFYLENAYLTCIKILEKKNISIPTDLKQLQSIISSSDFIDLKAAGSLMARLLLSKIFGKKLFFTIKKTNLFLLYPKIWIYGFCDCIKNTGSSTLYDYDSQNKKYFFNIIKKKKLLKFSYIFLYLKAFDYLIPKKTRKLIFSICYKTKNVHFLYYIFKKYENMFDMTIESEYKEYNDYVLNTKITNKLIEFEIEFESLKYNWEEF